MRPFLMLLWFSVSLLAQVPNWHGTWQGTLTNFPPRPGAPTVHVQMELGPFPVADNTCSTLRNTYREAGKPPVVKDYQLCRGVGPEDLYVDEGGGLKLSARWLGDALLTPFKYGSTLLLSTLRLRGDTLEEEIWTVEDKPATAGPLPLRGRGLQRLTLRRAKP